MNEIKVGFFLAIRQLKHASIWATILIVLVMVLTFLNLISVSGILVGLIEGINRGYIAEYTGDVFVTNHTNKAFIEQSQSLIKTIESLPEVKSYSARYKESGTIEAGFKEKIDQTDIPNRTGVTIVGIDPVKESETTKIASLLIAGEYLDSDDTDYVVVGADLLEKYSRFVGAGGDLIFFLKGADVGSEIRLTVNGVEKNVTIKGIIQSKVDQVTMRVYMNEEEFRKLAGRNDLNVDEIAIRLFDEADRIKRILIAAGGDKLGFIQTAKETQPQFVQDMTKTFNLLGSAIGSIGLAVASITIFIVIFINAISRRKYIGIMKGIGIHGSAIEISYIIQSLFYALAGTTVGVSLVYGILVPYFGKHPISFPFSDGVLVAPLGLTSFRVFLLLITTLVAGFIPAKLIIKKNTLDSILGR